MRDLVWKFETAKLTVKLFLEIDYGYRYDGEDENGETQAALDSGEYVAFDSDVEISLNANGAVIARDSLGGSVYAADEVADFYTAHRDPNPMNRNCSLLRAARGKVNICHYFPDMVRTAVQEARAAVAQFPAVRAVQS